MSIRDRIIEIAAAEVGSGRRADYWLSALGRDPGANKAWCGCFCLWALHEAGVALDVKWGIDGTGLVGPAHLKPTLLPRRGDIGYIDAPYQHHFLFDYEADGIVHSVDGNQGTPAVQRRARQRHSISRFYSIATLLPRDCPTDPAPPLERVPLSIGSQARDAVFHLQSLLNGTGERITVDGVYGPKTAAAVANYQRRVGLPSSGLVDAATWQALEAPRGA